MPHTKLNHVIFNFDFDRAPKEERFSELSFDSVNFILNAGSVFYFVVVWLILAIILLITKLFHFKKPGFKKIQTYL